MRRIPLFDHDVELLLGLMREAHVAEARKITRSFDERLRIGVAEFLLSASQARKYEKAKARLREMVGGDVNEIDSRKLKELFVEFELEPFGEASFFAIKA